MRLPGCSQCQQLELDVAIALERLRQLTTAQLIEFEANFQSGEFMSLDRQLENARSEKRGNALTGRSKKERRKRTVVFGVILIGTAAACWWLLIARIS